MKNLVWMAKRWLYSFLQLFCDFNYWLLNGSLTKEDFLQPWPSCGEHNCG